MAHTDRKERFPNSLPTPVQMSGPPPYAILPTSQNASPPPTDEWSARAQNHIHISRTFGAVARGRFTVDPNLHVPSSLLTPPEWDSHISLYSLRSRPKPNIELAVTFGGIDADIKVLPMLGSAEQCVNGRCTATAATSLLSSRAPCPRQSGLETSTTSGDITLHVDAAPNANFSVRASSTFGQICVFLPRTFHGPLTITSSLGAPSLSPELKRVCTPISEVGSGRRWFVGDVGLWHDRNEHGDEALLRTSWGRVWVGYAGEEEEAKRALRWGTLHWVVNLVLVLFMILGLHLAIKLLFWILTLVGLL